MMRNFTNLQVGDKVGVLTYGRRYDTAIEGTVAKVSPKSLTVQLPFSSGGRFNRETGSEIGGHRDLVALDNERYVKALAAQAEREAAGKLASDQARAEREARFGIAAIATDNQALSEALHDLGRHALQLEAKIRQRLEAVAPHTLHRELKWLEQCAADAAELNWYLSVFKELGTEAVADPIAYLREIRDVAKARLLQPYGTIVSDVEQLAELLAARAIHERVGVILQFKLGDTPPKD